MAPVESHCFGDGTRLDRLGQTLVHRLHSGCCPGLDKGIDLVGLGASDEIADGRVADHDLRHRGATEAARAEHELLGDDSFE